MTISEKRRIFEIIAVILTGLGKFLFMDILGFRFIYISSAIIFWLGYILFRKKEEAGILDYWGMNTNNFKQTFLELLPFAVILSIVFVVVGHVLEISVLNIRILPILLIYPLWGIIQQFIMIGILAKNLKETEKVKTNDFWVVLVTAAIFAVVHFPFLILVGATFLLALVYTTLYLRGRNLIVLGIYHGLLGALFFYTVMGRDPFLEVFG